MDGSCARGFRQRPVWLVAVALLVAGQAGTAAVVLGGAEGIGDARPVVAGRHPLHLYHGSLGAETFRGRSATACYDPNFQAGYPKTPVFDGGSRPAELFLFLGGRGFDPAAYKRGLFICCLLPPLAFAAAARGAGVCRAGAVLAAAAGCGVWWSPPARAAFDAGDLDLLLAGLSAVVYVGWLARYHWEPGVTSWLVLAACATAGWYAHPVVWLATSGVFAVYYLAVAPRHGLAWHLGLAGVTGVGLGLNMWWLWDWGKFWWLRQPSVDDVAPFPGIAAVIGDWPDVAALVGAHPFGFPVFVAALLGLGWQVYLRRRTAPLLFVMTALFAAVIARLGQVWPTFAAAGTDRAAPLIAALAVVPAAGIASACGGATKLGRLLLLLSAAGPAVVAWGGPAAGPVRTALGLDVSPIALGLTPDQSAFAKGLADITTPAARILLEDPDPLRPGWNWTALLPELTGRSYLGGLDPGAALEHAHCDFRATRLNGRPLPDWTDADLAGYCRRYNVGWVACRSAPAAARWAAFPGATEVARFRDGGDVILFALSRPQSYVLAGAATWQTADRRKVVLTDVIPTDAPNANGGGLPVKVIVLSLHYQAGLRVSPSIIRVERDPDPYDPIPMVRLVLPGPMSRVVISWDP